MQEVPDIVEDKEFKTMDVIRELKKKIASPSARVVFPEGEDEKIIQSARRIVDEAIGCPILLGDEKRIGGLAAKMQVNLKDIEVINPAFYQKWDSYLEKYCKERECSEAAARIILSKPVYFGAMMVKAGDADTMVAGIIAETEEVIMAGQLIVGIREGISTPSSFFLMEIPGYEGKEGNALIFADASVNPDPSAEQLADISLATAGSAVKLFGWEPRVALLSFSTKGSAEHESVDKVVEALRIVREREPSLCVDGEMQADAAIVPEVAMKKIQGGGAVCGQANILIFPDLNSANICYKLVQRLTKGRAYGPFLQGFARQISDLSRGASVEDVVGATIMSVVASSGNAQYNLKS